MKRYAYAWITLAFFAVSIVGHWGFGWYAFVNEAHEHGQPVELRGYLVGMGRDTFVNWQPEFLQLLWQVVGLTCFLYVGSPASRESDGQPEAKIDALIRLEAGGKAEDLLADIDARYLRAHGHAKPHGYQAEARALAPGQAS